MGETVKVWPPVELDEDGDPAASVDPIELVPLEVAPGNSVLQYGIGGDLDDVEFTVYLPLRIRQRTGSDFEWVQVTDLVADDSVIEVRDRTCTARVQAWTSQRSPRGGIAVLCRSATGKAA